MTYEEIQEKLKSKGLYATAEGLDRAVADEATALQENLSTKPRHRKAAEDAAREFYAEDITRQIAERDQPTPENMMHLRRFPVVWAVAEVLITNGLVPGKVS